MKTYFIGALIGLTVCAFTGVPGCSGIVERVDSWWNKPPEPIVLSELAQKISDFLDRDELWKLDRDELRCIIDKENQVTESSFVPSAITIQHPRFCNPIFLYHSQNYKHRGINITEGLTSQEFAFLKGKALELTYRLKNAKLQKVTDEFYLVHRHMKK